MGALCGHAPAAPGLVLYARSISGLYVYNPGEKDPVSAISSIDIQDIKMDRNGDLFAEAGASGHLLSRYDAGILARSLPLSNDVWSYAVTPRGAVFVLEYSGSLLEFKPGSETPARRTKLAAGKTLLASLGESVALGHAGSPVIALSRHVDGKNAQRLTAPFAVAALYATTSALIATAEGGRRIWVHRIRGADRTIRLRNALLTFATSSDGSIAVAEGACSRAASNEIEMFAKEGDAARGSFNVQGVSALAFSPDNRSVYVGAKYCGPPFDFSVSPVPEVRVFDASTLRARERIAAPANALFFGPPVHQMTLSSPPPSAKTTPYPYHFILKRDGRLTKWTVSQQALWSLDRVTNFSVDAATGELSAVRDGGVEMRDAGAKLLRKVLLPGIRLSNIRIVRSATNGALYVLADDPSRLPTLLYYPAGSMQPLRTLPVSANVIRLDPHGAVLFGGPDGVDRFSPSLEDPIHNSDISLVRSLGIMTDGSYLAGTLGGYAFGFDPRGKYLGYLSAGFDQADAIELDRHDDAYIVDRNCARRPLYASEVAVFTRDGTIPYRIVHLDAQHAPRALRIDADGTMYVFSRSCEPDWGEPVYVFAPGKDTPTEILTGLTDIAFSNL